MRGLLPIVLSLMVGFQCLAQTNQSYTPPARNDLDRVEKIKALLPLVDTLYSRYRLQKNMPSIAYGILVDGQLIASNAFGLTQVEPPRSANGQSLYRIASMSKSVTAVAILQLRDAGKVNLDDPAYKYLPELKSNKLLTSDAPAITIRHLLTHSAGFPEDNPWGDRQLEDSNVELMQLIKKGTYFSNVPGIAYEYSNLGFALLGQIVEKVSGMPLDVYTREKIFLPLGMLNSEWEYTKVPTEKFVTGYRFEHGVWKKEIPLHHGSYGAMGGLITSIEDFSKYVSLHMSAWPPRSGSENPVLKRSSLREMHMPHTISGFNPNNKTIAGRPCATVSAYNYGLGWVRDCEDKEYVGHSGGLPGYGSQWQFLPQYGIGVISFANLTYANAGWINRQVLDTLLRSAHLAPYVLPTSVILQQRQKQIVKLLPDWNENTLATYTTPAQNIFSENFFPDYPIRDLRAAHSALFNSIGTIQTIEEIKAENQLRGSFDIVGDKGRLRVFFTLTPENPPLIQELRLTPLKN